MEEEMDDGTQEQIEAARIEAYERWDRDFDLGFEEALDNLAFAMEGYLTHRTICLNVLAIPEEVPFLPKISKDDLKRKKDDLIAAMDAVRTRLAIGGL